MKHKQNLWIYKVFSNLISLRHYFYIKYGLVALRYFETK